MPEPSNIDTQIQELHDKAAELVQKAEQNPSEASDLKAYIEKDIQPVIDRLEQERKDRQHESDMKALNDRVTTMKQALDQLREPGTDFIPGGGKAVEGADVYGPDSEHSFYADIKAVNKGNAGAQERMAKALGQDVKAMSSLTDAAGGYLTPTIIGSEIIRLRDAAATLRPLFSQITVTSDSYQLPAVTGGLTVGWVAELAEKPVSDLTFGQITTSVFTAAGLAAASNQLLADSRPSVDGLINFELAKRLAILEEKAFLNGSGTGQPRGILNTSGVGTTALTSTAVLDLLDAILTAATAVETAHQEYPTAIVLHPRTWNRIVAARETSTSAQYIIGEGANAQGRRASDARPARSLFGIPVYTSSNVPTNLGTGTNESRVIVGVFSEGLILDRQGITLDESEHVYFTSNQTVFRGEERVGFTAARYPTAFNVVGGVGLVNG